MDEDNGRRVAIDAAADTSMSAFLDPGMDFTKEDLAADEAARYLAWCKRVHGEGNLDLVPFAEFFVEFDPRGLKTLRRHTGTIRLPTAAAVLMWAHTYCVLGFEKGVLYEVIAARELGVTRDEVVEVLRVAGFLGGPFALNAAGELTHEYLRRWTTEPLAGSVEWPPGWAADPHVLEAGIDHASTELLDGELDAISSWYERVHYGMPTALVLSARLQPSAFKMARVRFERLPGGSLPAQLLPLLLLHTAVIRGSRLSVRRAVELAFSMNVTADIVVDTIQWASVFGGPLTAEEAFDAASTALDRAWGATSA